MADYSKLKGLDKETQALYSIASAGYISQNVYLFSGSAGLSTAVRALIGKTKLAEEMELVDGKKIILGQAVGYPK